MYHDLDGKVIIVTGAGRGLGAAAAHRLATEGAHVVVVDVDADNAAQVASSLPTDGVAHAADVSEEGAIEGAIETAVHRWGGVDHFHFNAGITGTLAPLPDVTADDFDRVMAVNVRGVFLGLRAAMRSYADQRRRGAVVITASIVSLRGSSDLIAYQTSKHAVIGLLRAAAVHGGPLGVRVNAVAPGIVPTGLFAASAHEGRSGGGDDTAQRAANQPLRRAGTPEEVAAVVSFLLSDESSFMTGAVVSADGGASAVNPVRPSGGAGRWDPGPFDDELYGSELLQAMGAPR